MMNPNQVLRDKGQFTRIAATMRKTSGELINEPGLTKDNIMVDLGWGDGSNAIPAASLAIEVLAVDIARNLLEAGNIGAKNEQPSKITIPG
jgi:ubiquinone/menaquinone biosynthesis C-methylase UbiE